MTKLTYTAHAEPGQGLTLSPVSIVKGWNAIVKRGDATVYHGPLMQTASAAMRYATSKAAEYRAYRQKHGEGIEDRQTREAETKRAERRRLHRINQKDRATYDLIQQLAADAELVKEWLPTQAISRLEKVRELVAFVETDPPKV